MKVGETLADIAENEGLRATKGARGVTFWYRFRCPVTGKLKRVTIGHARDMHLAHARVKLQELKAARSAGRDPAELVNAKRQATVKKEPDGPTVTDVVEAYLTHLQRRRKAKGVADTRRMLTNCVIGKIGDRPALSVTRRDVLDLVNGQIENGNRVQAGRVLREMAAAFEMAVLTGQLPDDFVNPAALAKESVRAAGLALSPNRRQRVLTDSELVIWWQWLHQPGIVSDNHRRALKLTLQTGCRSGEAIAARWEHFDLRAGVWHLPDTKTGVPRTVVLPRQTLEWLRAEHVLRPGDEWLCPSPKRSKGHVEQKSITERLWALRRDGRLPKIAPWTPHDLRRTCRTGLARLGCPSEVAEAAIGHARGGIEKVYNTHRYEREIGEWLQRWCDHLDQIFE
jgi:integrase